MAGNFVKIRRGVLQHLHENRLTFSEFGVFQLLLLQADAATGVVWTNSQKIAGMFNDTVNQRVIMDALSGLKKEGYIKSFQQTGSRGSYPILINKYEVTVGGLKGGLTNANQTVDWKQVVVAAGSHDVADEESDEATDKVSDEVTPYSRTVDSKTERAGDSNSTVPGTAGSSQVNGEGQKQKNTENMKPARTISDSDLKLIKTDWIDIFGDYPYNPDDMVKLLQNYHVEDIIGVMWWLLYIHKSKGDFNWAKNIHSSGDYARCFKGMFPQYLKCGGADTALALAKKIKDSQVEQDKKNTHFCLDCRATWKKGQPGNHKTFCPRYVPGGAEVSFVDDMKEEEIPYR